MTTEPDHALRLPDKADQRCKAEALQRWTVARGRLVFRQPLLASLALHLQITPVVDERVPTACTDGRSIFVNPYFLETLNDEESLFVFAHEVWHCGLLHFKRQQRRDAERWNIAIDHEVNALLVEQGLVIPEDAILFADLASHVAAEEVYDGLSELRPRGRLADVHLGLPGEPVVHTPHPDPPPDQSAFERVAGKRDPDFSAGVQPEAAEAWPGRVIAVAREFRARGELPGALERLVDNVLEPTVRWQTVLASFVRRVPGGAMRWLPPSRRHVHRGLYLPSRRAQHLDLVVAIDTSWSTAEAIPTFVAEFAAILASFDRYEVLVLLCDADIQAEHRFSDSRPFDAGTLVVSGGGGTDFRPVFRRLQGEPPAALVYLTDGYGEAPATAPRYPVLWVLTPDGQKPTTWGADLRLDLENLPDTDDA